MQESKLGDSAGSYSRHNHHTATLEKTMVSIIDRCVHRTQPMAVRTAVYETPTYGGVRGALRSFGAEPSTRLGDVFLFIFYFCIYEFIFCILKTYTNFLSFKSYVVFVYKSISINISFS